MDSQFEILHSKFFIQRPQERSAAEVGGAPKEKPLSIVYDNLLWGGKVAEGESDPSTDALRRFNRRIVSHARLITVILPLGDGTGVSVLK